MDMIAHNNDREKDVFQIAPGVNRESMLLAEEAHAATEIWNASTPAWNHRADAPRCFAGKRTADGVTIPDVALHLPLKRRGPAALLSPHCACTTPTARSSPTPACRSSCSWRTMTSTGRAITTRTTRWRTSISTTARLGAIAIESVAQGGGAGSQVATPPASSDSAFRQRSLWSMLAQPCCVTPVPLEVDLSLVVSASGQGADRPASVTCVPRRVIELLQPASGRHLVFSSLPEVRQQFDQLRSSSSSMG